MKYMMVISYDGAKFHGFQRQNDVKNVQGYIESILTNLLGETICVKGAGRTDKGVHARYQVVHFETNNNKIITKKYLNSHLEDVRVRKIKEVSSEFHARHSVKGKTYIYKLSYNRSCNVNYETFINKKLNIKKMREASKYMIGTHDYRNFVAGKRIDYTTTITKIKIYHIGKSIYLVFKGIGFYRYMVRNLVGALVEVGKEKVETSVIKDMIDLKIERSLPTISANGLYLWKINY